MTKTQETRIQCRWIPAGAVERAHKLGTVYVYTTPAGKPAAVAYRGTSQKSSWHHSFYGLNGQADAAREKHITEWFADLEAAEARRAEQLAERKTPHSLKVGDVVVNSWGYDQTQADFHIVTKTTDHYVWLAEIASIQHSATTDMSGMMIPEMPIRQIGEATKHFANGRNVTMDHGVP